MGHDLVLYPHQEEAIVYALDLDPDAAVPQGFTVKRHSLGADGFGQLRQLLQTDLAALSIGTVGVAPDSGRHVLPGNSAENSPFSVPLIHDFLSSVTVQETDFFAQQAMRKTAAEVEKIQRANDIAAFGLRAFYANLQPGRTEAELAALVEGAIQSQSGKHGSSLARAWAYIQAGPNSAKAGTYSRSSGYAMQAGDMVVLEMGTWVDGYWSDLTRTAVVGTPSADQARLIETVQTAQQAAIDAMRPGVSHADVDTAARQIMEAAGYGAAFTHHTGHHVGFRYHDYGPLAAPGSTEPLAEGMIITIEPGAYGELFGGGCRFEENVLVTESGARVLSDQQIRG
ncbi:MAG: aminopeptidase P family protein [Anaerolineae bacterium]|nr:aminopeptidase P family protein [Anaerolineae bacterium]